MICAPPALKKSAITFQAEKWADALPELRPLFTLLWEDVAVSKDRFRARCNEKLYAQMEQIGFLRLVTMRADSRLGGYFTYTVLPNGHYADDGLMAFTDMYFLHPDFRRANVAVQFFRFVI